jgi:hypothetical protein
LGVYKANDPGGNNMSTNITEKQQLARVGPVAIQVPRRARSGPSGILMLSFGLIQNVALTHTSALQWRVKHLASPNGVPIADS